MMSLKAPLSQQPKLFVNPVRESCSSHMPVGKAKTLDPGLRPDDGGSATSLRIVITSM